MLQRFKVNVIYYFVFLQILTSEKPPPEHRDDEEVKLKYTQGELDVKIKKIQYQKVFVSSS